MFVLRLGSLLITEDTLLVLFPICKFTGIFGSRGATSLNPLSWIGGLVLNKPTGIRFVVLAPLGCKFKAAGTTCLVFVTTLGAVENESNFIWKKLFQYYFLHWPGSVPATL